MNFGLVTSYIIAGILLISILAMNMSLSNNSTELTLTQTIREKASGIVEFIEHDIQKMGYNRTGKTSPILVTAEDHKIQFRSNIDNSLDNSVELITWEFTSNSVSNTENPNDYVLKRISKDLDTGTEEQTPIRLGVTNFEIRYLDKYGAPISNYMSTPVSSSDLDDIKQLYIKLELQSAEKVYQNSGGDGRYVTTVWEKRFSPGNLENTN